MAQITMVPAQNPTSMAGALSNRKRTLSISHADLEQSENYGRGCRKRCKSQKAEEHKSTRLALAECGNAVNIDKGVAKPSKPSSPKIILKINKSVTPADKTPAQDTGASTHGSASESDSTPRKIKLYFGGSKKIEQTLQTSDKKGSEPNTTKASTRALTETEDTATASTTRTGIKPQSESVPRPAPKARTVPVDNRHAQVDADLDRANQLTSSGPYETSEADGTAARKINAAEHPVEHLVHFLENMPLPAANEKWGRREFVEHMIRNEIRWLRGPMPTYEKKMLVKFWWSAYWNDGNQAWNAAWQVCRVGIRMLQEDIDRPAAVEKFREEELQARRKRNAQQAKEEEKKAAIRRRDAVRRQREAARQLDEQQRADEQQAAAGLLRLGSNNVVEEPFQRKSGKHRLFTGHEDAIPVRGDQVDEMSDL